jgi:hypothetical protein
MEATCFSETSVDCQRTGWRYIPEDRTLHNHRWENLKFYTGLHSVPVRNDWKLEQACIEVLNLDWKVWPTILKRVYTSTIAIVTPMPFGGWVGWLYRSVVRSFSEFAGSKIFPAVVRFEFSLLEEDSNPHCWAHAAAPWAQGSPAPTAPLTAVGNRLYWRHMHGAASCVLQATSLVLSN